MEQPGGAYLDIRLAHEPATIWRTVALVDAETLLGRPESGLPGVDLACKGISRRHACVRRAGAGEATSYAVENLEGKGGVRVYETILRPGEHHALHHGYVFHIPAVLAHPAHLAYQITFCENAQRTACLALQIHQPPWISIFGNLRKFKPLHYNLLAYLYRHKNEFCPYAEIFEALWPPGSYRPASPGDSLHSHKSRVQDVIREASGGVTLIETIHGEGLCLRV